MPEVKLLGELTPSFTPLASVSRAMCRMLTDSSREKSWSSQSPEPQLYNVGQQFCQLGET